ncbi:MULTISPECIES: TetR/AcrR family transcriptional regulator [Caproicibacterium]|uniref:TetR/AcrR family transcriptional regulator n=1 Tax=Caproicibacterium argilliputei TaxID=3030016 RepID=A0AA97H321_9FIRM|nr:TetR/AcrR family transcriptional regulator [Caproicibacterium argilliputei]WOC31803.1 TetR/AcrR family transcriptional regulator [Caproicibacterium argilliputei]
MVQMHSADRRILKTKQAIHNALIQLMSRKAVSEITVRELTETANISRKTFYLHYADLTDVFREIESDLLRSLHTLLHACDFANRQSGISELFSGLNDLIQRDRPFYHQLVRSEYFGSFLVSVKQALKEELRLLAAQRPTSRPKLRELSLEFAAAGLVSMYLEWFRSETNLPLRSVSEAAQQMIRSSILATA